ncbi:hypothetical protein EBS02_03735, partial [bacterium]|nr:hypothetical protein [bacterium]
YYIDIYKFWIEPFDSHISLTGENLVYGIFHHCLDKDIFENFNGRIDIKSLRTISLYCEDAPSFQVSGYLKDEADRSDKNSQIIESIKKLPRYFTLLKEVIAGKMEPKEAEIISSGVLSAKIL